MTTPLIIIGGAIIGLVIIIWIFWPRDEGMY